MDWIELFGDRTARAWSTEQAVRRALDELLVAVVDAREMERRQLDLGDFLRRFRGQHVLLLGDFGGGRERLQAMASVLEQRGYLPVFADEIPDIRVHDLRQKIIMLALACRFVFVDDSSPAGQLTELPVMEFARVPTVVLRALGMRSSWMTEGLSLNSPAMLELKYDAASLADVVGQGIEWAESAIGSRGQQLDDLFPWRGEPPEAGQ